MTSESYPFLNHCEDLESRYSEVGNITWDRSDFNVEKLESSRDLFTLESLENRSPITKRLEVYALLSGLPFENDFVGKLVNIQEEIQKILCNSLAYWVKPQNLALEHCVFKWPYEKWNPDNQSAIEKAIHGLKYTPFNFHINGFQINPDGCVIAKGFDEDLTIMRIREELRNELDFLPKKQSNWAHVPLGRILENFESEKFSKLQDFVQLHSQKKITQTRINSLHLIHEEQWYMEKRKTILTHKLVK